LTSLVDLFINIENLSLLSLVDTLPLNHLLIESCFISAPCPTSKTRFYQRSTHNRLTIVTSCLLD